MWNNDDGLMLAALVVLAALTMFGFVMFLTA